MILYLLLFVSVLIDSLKNIYYNYFGKSRLEKPGDAFLFNFVCCIGSALFMATTGAPLKVSSYSILMAAAFAAVTVGAQYFQMLAMALGPMSFSVLFTYLSMLIPTLFGVVFYGTHISVMQIVGLILMIMTFVLSVDLKKDSGVSVKWLFAAFASFLSWGLVGICQQLHQNSAHADELKGFLLWTFIFSTIMFALLCLPSLTGAKKEPYNFKINSTDSLFALGAGLIIGSVNIINLYLAGKMPSIIFFPIVNGGVIILCGIAAAAIFREKLKTQQFIGLITGIASVCLLGM